MYTLKRILPLFSILQSLLKNLDVCDKTSHRLLNRQYLSDIFLNIPYTNQRIQELYFWKGANFD